MSDAVPLPAHPRLEYYKHLAKDLQHACRSGDPEAIRAWARDAWNSAARAAGIRDEAFLDGAGASLVRQWHAHRARHPRTECQLSDAQFFVAVAHGFASWPKFAAHVAAVEREDSAASRFERAADAIVAGDVGALDRLLGEDPSLVGARSARDHHSTLLHYVSANGVEDFRQKTPPNIVEIARRLIDAGADVNAESEAYGGGSTTLGLAATSLHPEAAGVQIALLELLLARGARTEQRSRRGDPIRIVGACLANGQGDAARFFAQRGEPLDLEEAAGVGRLDVVRERIAADADRSDEAFRRQLEKAFLNACGYGHADIAACLLNAGVDVNLRNRQRQTGLHWAMYGPHLDVVELLLGRGVDVNARDAHEGTALDWAVNGWAHADSRAERESLTAVARRLAGAGGRISPSWFAMHRRRQEALDRARRDETMAELIVPRAL